MGMRCRNCEDGSSLILIIGVIAALAIMAAGLVVLTTNVASNTSKQRTRTKAFDVAEGALDVGMNMLAGDWPGPTADPAPTWDESAFRQLDQYGNPSEYPDPTNTAIPFSSVTFYDDGGGDGGYTAASKHVDANGNDMMWIIAKGATGSQQASVQAKVVRDPANTGFPHGVALFVGGVLDPNDPGNITKTMVHIEDQGTAPSVNSYASAYGAKLKDVYEKTGSTVMFDTGVTPRANDPRIPADSTTDPVPRISSLIDSGIISGITALAQSMGRYYDVTHGDPMPTDLSGICVIRADGTHPVDLGNGQWNTLDEPGILLVLRVHTASPDPEPTPPVTFNMSGSGNFYGVIYVEGTCDTAHGSPAVHGMLGCNTNMTMQGTPDVYYNDTIISKLTDKWTLTVSLVPNTWREIHP